MRNEFQLQIILTIFFWSSSPPLFCKTSLSISERIWHAKKHLADLEKSCKSSKMMIMMIILMMMMTTLVHLFWKSWYDQKYLRPIIHDFHMLEELCDIDFLSNRSEEFRYKIYQNNISKKFIPISNTLNHLFSEEKSILSIWQIKDFLNVFPVAKNKSFLDLLQNISFLYSPTFSPLCSLDFINSVK